MANKNDIYSIKAKAINGDQIDFEKYKGKCLLIVNTASQCGFTPQYDGLENLNQKYKNDGLEILGFPCDQFGGQEPGNDEQIAEGCRLNHGVTFQLFSKVNVNGKNEHELFTYLKNKKSGFLGSRIKWNFTKFLVDKNGNVVERFSPNTAPSKIEPKIMQLL